MPRLHSRRTLISAGLLGWAASCSGGGGSDSGGTVPPTPPSNVLLIVADDVGVDMLGAYGVHPNFPPTPHIDALIAQGVLFERCYTSPTCSPTRAAILTGRYSFRTGLGQPIQEWLPEHALQLDEVTVPEMLHASSQGAITSTAIGKWHLGSAAVGDIDHPNLQGFDWFEGTFGNLYFGQTYYDHSKITNGVRESTFVYSTTEQVDDALERIEAMPEPWFLYLAFNAAHQPFHAPPPALHTYTLAGNPDDTPYEHYSAAIQAIDTEVGRLLNSIDSEVLSHTTVIFIGDNGSPNQAVIPPSVPGLSKGSLYEGGVRVPLVVAGPKVTAHGERCSALINSVDLFPTIANLMGVDMRAGIGDNRPIDGVAFDAYLTDPAHSSLRAWAIAEKFSPNGFGPYASQGWMIRDERWKVIRRTGQPDFFFDMDGLAFEGVNLAAGALTPEQQAAYDRLSAQLAAVLAGP
ncbi:MAG: sulfatase-like hydrolase/transferase [Planctomycetes bacterium]|nr:sulfatase-like hydrolase/transferase [Planctomycetota bacterium]